MLVLFVLVLIFAYVWDPSIIDYYPVILRLFYEGIHVDRRVQVAVLWNETIWLLT